MAIEFENRIKESNLTMEWDKIPWKSVDLDVKQLRCKIFSASRAKSFKKLRDLQDLMIHSLSNTLLTTRRVTSISCGKNTPGIDQKVFITNKQGIDMAETSWYPYYQR